MKHKTYKINDIVRIKKDCDWEKGESFLKETEGKIGRVTEILVKKRQTLYMVRVAGETWGYYGRELEPDND